MNERIKSKGCDGSGSGGRLNRPLVLLKTKIKKLSCDDLSSMTIFSYINLTQSDLNPEIMF